jgi:hypothetical protein
MDLLLIKLFTTIGTAAANSPAPTDRRPLSQRPIGQLPLPLWCAVQVYRLFGISH